MSSSVEVSQNQVTPEVTLQSSSTHAYLELQAPVEFLQLFDREICQDLCWDGVMLGQSEQELMDVVGGQVFRREDLSEVNAISVDWEVAVHGADRERYYGTAMLSDNQVESLYLPMVDAFPLQILFNELGQPKLLEPLLSDPKFFFLFYPSKQVGFIVRAVALPAEITGESLVETIVLFNEHETKLYECGPYFRYWEWNEQSQKVLPGELSAVKEYPEWCNADS